MDYLQKPVTYSKSLVHLSKVCMLMNISVPQNKSQFVMLSHVVYITVHTISITWCKLWQQFGWQLLYWNAEGYTFLCTPYSVSISKVKNVHITVRGTLIGCILHPASAIVWPRLTTWSKIVALIQSYMHLYVLGLFLCLPLKPFTMHPYPLFFSWLLTLIIFWMFIHCQNV